MSEKKELRIPEPIPLKIGDRDFMFHFNNYALVVLGDLIDQGPLEALMDISKKDILEGITYLIYSGIVGYEKAQGNFNHGIHISVVSSFLAVSDITQFNYLFDVYKQSTGMSKTLEDLAGQEAKTENKKKAKSLGRS